MQEMLARGQAAAALSRLEARAAAASTTASTTATTTAAPAGPQAEATELRFLRGVALMDLRCDGEALAWFEQMVQDHPELPDPLNNVAVLHARAGKLELARQALEAALRNDPSYRVARANLGLVYLMLAVQAWEQAAAASPLDAQLARRLEGARALLQATAR